MCGLVGIAGDVTAALKESFKDMLLINQVRGRDATGAFSVNSGDSWGMAKCLGTPELLFDTKSFEENVMRGLNKIYAGHCRSKTAGDNTRANAHPYVYDDELVGMHNGTLRSYYQMEGYDHNRTDSYALYHNLHKYGAEETISKLDADGAWALVWYDARDKTLNFIRNEQRPLWFTWTKNKRAMLWASEPGMFWAASRKVDLWDGTSEGSEERVSPYFQLPPHQLYSFEVDDRAKATEPTMRLKPIREIKPEVKKAVNFPKYSGGASRPPVHRWQEGSNGGQVVRPFLPEGSLDDPIDDVGGKGTALITVPQHYPQRPANTPTAAESQTTSGTVSKSSKSSHMTSDFRPASMRGKNSSRPTLSLVETKSKATLLDSNGKPLSSSKGCTDQQGNCLSSPALPKKLVDFRTISNTRYITDMKSGVEWTEAVFEDNTGGICTFCKSPIGDITEVAEFLRGGKSFVCTSCYEEPAHSHVAVG